MSETKPQSNFDSAKAEAFVGRFLTPPNNGALCLMTSIGHRAGIFNAMRGLSASTSTEMHALHDCIVGAGRGRLGRDVG